MSDAEKTVRAATIPYRPGMARGTGENCMSGAAAPRGHCDRELADACAGAETADAIVDAVMDRLPGLLAELIARDGDPDGNLAELADIVSWWPDLSDESVEELLTAFPGLVAA